MRTAVCVRAAVAEEEEAWPTSYPNLTMLLFFFKALLLTESQIEALKKHTPQLLFYHPVAEQRSRGL